jgi:hypothetical protein
MFKKLLITLLVMLALVAAVPALSDNYIHIYGRPNSDFVGNNWTWHARGEVSGTYNGKMVVNEEGERFYDADGKYMYSQAYDRGTITMADGSKHTWSLGTADDRYIFYCTPPGLPQTSYLIRADVYWDGVFARHVETRTHGEPWNFYIYY